MKKNVVLILGFIIFGLTAYSQGSPKATYKVGNVKVIVWENEIDGEYGTYIEKNFKVEKIYKKGDEWKSTNYYNLKELLQLQAAIDKAINEEVVEIE
jgi:hypothetical protein